ncbi:MAG: hypothetical protein K0U84_19035 [Actinomycetia bacterium]|nr:hypothetical protein [Actinomycetes bacterium]
MRQPCSRAYLITVDQGLVPSQILAKFKTIGEELGGQEDPSAPVDPKTEVTLGNVGADAVTDGKW